MSRLRQLRRSVGNVPSLFPEAKKSVVLHRIKLCFDGGCSTDEHRKAYGSYAVWLDDKQAVLMRCDFGCGSTNNIAEWMSLLRAIEFSLTICDPATTSLTVRGDSNIVVNGASGKWKVKALHLRPIAEKVRLLAGKFASAEFAWWSRTNSVRIFGH